MMATPAKAARDLRFDSLRGLMLVMMTVNHIPSSLRFLTDRSMGIFSAAESFVFLSGIMAGWVYTRRRQREGSEGLWRATRGRASMIYRWHLGSFLCALVAVRLTDCLWGFCSQNSPQLFYQNPTLALALGCTLLYQPGMLDILPLYCAMVVALPWVLDQLENGRRWLILGLSGLIWFAVQWAPPTDGGQFFPVVVGSFNLFAWQFLFFTGVVIGHARATPLKHPIAFKPLIFALATGLAVFGWGVAHLRWRVPGTDDLFGALLNKPALGAIRLVDFLAFAYLVGTFGARFPKLLTWRPLAFLGQHSIAVFAVQSVVAIFVCQFTNLFATTIGNYLMTAACIGLLWVPAAVHQWIQTRGRKSVPIGSRQLSPA